jgi:hypothetical protein
LSRLKIDYFGTLEKLCGVAKVMRVVRFRLGKPSHHPLGGGDFKSDTWEGAYRPCCISTAKGLFREFTLRLSGWLKCNEMSLNRRLPGEQDSPFFSVLWEWL